MKQITTTTQSRTEVDAQVSSEVSTQLRGRLLIVARLAWVVLCVMAVTVYVALVPINLRNIVTDWELGMSFPAISSFISMRQYGIYILELRYVALLVFLLTAIIIFWRKSDDWIALLICLSLVIIPLTFGFGGYTETWSMYSAPWSMIFSSFDDFLRAFGLVCLSLIVYIFPDGRFVPRWIAVLCIIALSIIMLFLRELYLFPYDSEIAFSRLWITFIVSFIMALVSQIYRYRYKSNRIQRQQTKWFVFSLVIVCIYMALSFLLMFIPASSPYKTLLHLIDVHIQLFSLNLIPITITFSILRYKLWDIDIIIRRTLIYGALTSCVIVVYAFVVGGLSTLLPSQGSLLNPIVALGLIAILFGPLRRWLQVRIEQLLPIAPQPAAETSPTIRPAPSRAIPPAANEPLSTHLRGRPLALARIGWVAAVGLALMYIALLAPSWPNLNLQIVNDIQLNQLLILALSLPYWVIAGLIAWRASKDGVAIFVSATLVLFGAAFFGYMVWGNPGGSVFWHASWRGLVETTVRAAAWGTLLIFFLIFPNGRFVPSWTRWLALGWIVYVVSWLLFPQLDPHINDYAADLPMVTCSVVGMIAQLIRYCTEPDAVRRQQIKWVIFGFTLSFLGIGGITIWLQLFPQIESNLLGSIGLPAHLISFTLIPLIVGFAVLRYRLWDIDIIIRRTLIYGAITAGAFVTYLLAVGGTSLVLQARSELVAGVIAIGLVVIAFMPVRRRLYVFMDRVMPVTIPMALAAQEQRRIGIVKEVETARQRMGALNVINQGDQSEIEQPNDTRLRGFQLILMRVAWGIIAALVLVHVITRVRPIYSIAKFQEALNISIQLFQLGISRDLYATSIVVLFLFVSLSFIIFGIVLFWKKPGSWFTFCISVMLMAVGARFAFAESELGIRYPWWLILDTFITILAKSSSLLFFYLFPNGRFVPRWTRLLAVVWIGWVVANYFSARIDDWLEQKMGWPLMFLPWFLWYATGVFAQIYRYNYISKPIERQQTKWVLFGLTAPVSMFAFVLLLLLFEPWFLLLLPSTTLEWIFGLLFQGYLAYLTLLFVPLSIGIAILRYRLWDIDIIIRRTLTYGALVGALALVFFGSVAALQLLAQALTGPQSNLLVVATTLILAALFQPVRQRVQGFVDRRFYREKVDFRQAFTDFAREVRTIIELPELLRALVKRTTDLLHITHGAVFLRSDDGMFVVAEVRNLSDSTALLIDDELLERLHHGQTVARTKDSIFPLLVPLIAPVSQPEKEQSAEILVGVLALGPRLSEQRYTRDDEALLLGLADQAGTAIYVAQLIVTQQAEARRRTATEHELETRRNSPIGRAEAAAQMLLADPGMVLTELHQLADQAGHDPAAAQLLEHIPRAIGMADHPRAGELADLADGFNYLFASQFQPELLTVGLRTLISQLELATGQRSMTDDLAPTTVGDDGATALAIYRLSLRMLEAGSIAHITTLTADDWSLTSAAPAPLTELTRALVELMAVVDVLRAYERVDTNQDKLAYLASAVERLSRVDRLARAELGAADRPLAQRIAESWLAVVTGAMGDLQTRAEISCTLLTRHTWVGDMIALVLAIRNDGRSAALGLSINLTPAPEYTLLDKAAQIERLAAGEEVEVTLRVRPQLAAGADQFRARFLIRYADPRGPNQVEHFADEVRLLAASEPFQFIPNPYVVGTPLQSGSPLFFGRADLLAYITENLAAAHRNNLVLIGQRRTGKTSLLKQLPAQLGDDYLPIYLDGQSLGLDPGLPNFFLALATEITFALDDRGFSVPPPELGDFAASPSATFEHVFLAQVRSAIGERHILLLLDEFEELEAAVRRGTLDASIFGFLRHIIQHSGNLSVIFCGTHRLEELAADYWSVLFNISLYRHVGFLERGEAERLIQDPVAPFGMRYDDLALEKIWRVTAGHPYFLQLLCHSLVNRHNKGERGYVTIADVNAALDEILAAGEAHFVYLWAESNEDERLTLAALSRLMPMTGHAAPAQVHDYLAERGVVIERHVIAPALHRLALRDILIATSAGDVSVDDVYHWKLGLLGLWVEKYRSLSRVVDEVHT